MTRRKKSRAGDPTREVLLDTAESLFAERGVDAVSVRTVNQTAGLAPAAVHYHFGSKDSLLDAVVDRHAGPVVARIVELTDALLDAEHLTGHHVVAVLAQAYAELLEREPVRGARWLSIMGQLSLSRDPRVAVAKLPATARLRLLAARAYPDAAEADIEACLPVAADLLLIMMSRAVRSPAQHTTHGPTGGSSYRDVLVDFAAGGLEQAMCGALARRPARTATP